MGKAQAVLKLHKGIYNLNRESKKLMTEFIASKQQRTLEKANAQNNNNEDKKIKKEEALADQQKAADEKEARQKRL